MTSQSSILNFLKISNFNKVFYLKQNFMLYILKKNTLSWILTKLKAYALILNNFEMQQKKIKKKHKKSNFLKHFG